MAQPIRITKQTKAVLPWVNSDETRPTLQNVLIEPDGRAMATNGSGLVILEERHPLNLDEYPGAHFPVQREPLTESVLLPAESIRAVVKAIPKPLKHGACPILQNAVQVTNGNGHITMGVTDLSTAQTFEIQPAAGPFVPYERVIPQSEPAVKIGMAVEYLAKLVESCKAIDTKYVTLEVWDATHSMRWTAKGDDATLMLILMPARI